MKNLIKEKGLIFRPSKQKLYSLKILFITATFLLLVGCSNEPEILESQTKEPASNETARIIGEIKLEDGILEFPNKESLQNLGNSYQNSTDGQNKFNDLIRDFQDNGFVPLTPIFD